MSTQAIEKILSANDIGETGGHQAGFLIPKQGGILEFFPQLDASAKNPRVVLDVTDDAGKEWAFTFIYYNNRFFKGTRNEYRLTGMTAYFREYNLKVGDTIILRKEGMRLIKMTIRRLNKGGPILKLSSSWKVIEAEF